MFSLLQFNIVFNPKFWRFLFRKMLKQVSRQYELIRNKNYCQLIFSSSVMLNQIDRNLRKSVKEKWEISYTNLEVIRNWLRLIIEMMTGLNRTVKESITSKSNQNMAYGTDIRLRLVLRLCLIFDRVWQEPNKKKTSWKLIKVSHLGALTYRTKSSGAYLPQGCWYDFWRHFSCSNILLISAQCIISCIPKPIM